MFRSKLVKDMQSPKPLPMGRAEFETWSDRIIALAMVPGATPESQKFVLADLILHLNATEDFKEDGYFIKVLRKVAINQVANELRAEIKTNFDKRKLEEASKASQPNVDVTTTQVTSHEAGPA